MKNKTTKQSNKKFHFLPLPVYVIYLLVCTLLLTGVTFSKYTAASGGEDSATVAGCLVTVKGDDLSDEIVYGEGEDNRFQYVFSVSSESDVAMDYDVIVDLGRSLPDGMEMTLDNGIGYNKYEDGKYVFEDAGYFEAGKKEDIDHILLFEVIPDEIDNADYAFDISVSVLAQQID